MVTPLYALKLVEIVVTVEGMGISDENTRPKVKLSRELYAKSKQIAKSDGRSFSSYVERLIEQDVQKKLTEPTEICMRA